MVVKVGLHCQSPNMTVYVSPEMQAVFDALETEYPNVQFSARVQLVPVESTFHPGETVSGPVGWAGLVGPRDPKIVDNPPPAKADFLELNITLPTRRYLIVPTVRSEIGMNLVYESVWDSVYLDSSHVELLEKFRAIIPDVTVDDIFNDDSDGLLRDKVNLLTKKYERTCLQSERPEDVNVLYDFHTRGPCNGVSFTVANKNLAAVTPDLLAAIRDLLR